MPKTKINTKLHQIQIPKSFRIFDQTHNKIQNLRIKDEIILLYIKNNLNSQLYHSHIELSNTWGSKTWHIIGLITY